MIAWVGEPCTT